MTASVQRDVDYRADEATLRGLLLAPAGAESAPTVVLFHDAFGLGPEMIAHAETLSAAGYTVFAADVWGERLTPQAPTEIGPLIGSMAGERSRWHGRLRATLAAAVAQPEVDAKRIALLGFCFGGSSALELLRIGADIRGVVAIHPGLDLIETDFAAASPDASALVSVGLSDPMATREQRTELEDALTVVGIDAEFNLYTHTTHAFTSLNAQNSPHPEAFAYHPRNAARAWSATVRFLGELFPENLGR